ncbi:hypothetical protein [Muricoccus radiodurans]|uniref:hypothetical protein n=1 Tax=Muricoccus radiodurans TaxID=2231721 RepID=UPI003CF335DC
MSTASDARLHGARMSVPATMESRRPAARPIGGFFPLDLGPAAGPGVPVAARWFEGSTCRGYANARSALGLGLLSGRDTIRTLWMPGFLCAAMGRVAESALRRRTVETVARYPLAASGSLSPDPAFLDAKLREGDAVLAVDYFGQPPAPEFRELVARRRDVLWIEDRAGALWPGDPWGDALLYSPRKLLGVPDGGYLVLPPASRFGAPDPGPPPGTGAIAPLLPALLRFEDPEEADNDTWFAFHRAREAGETLEARGPSHLTDVLLRRLDLSAMAVRRVANRSVLLRRLPPALRDGVCGPTPHVSDWVPQGVPVLVPDADAVARRMAAERVFCPVIWPDMDDPGPCARSAGLAGRVLLLPCDHRYGTADMERVAGALLRAL